MSEFYHGLEKLSSAEFLKLQPSHFVIDTRMPEVFASCHIKKSVNIPRGDAFCGWAGSVAPRNEPLILIVDEVDQLQELADPLLSVGLTGLNSFIVWDRNLKVEMDSLELLPVSELYKTSDCYIVDVRTYSEWTLGHIETAHHIELAKLTETMKNIPRDKKIATICGSGFRSSIAASILQKHDYPNVASVQGGMNAWRRASLPIKNHL